MSTPGTNPPCCDRPPRGGLVGPVVMITLGVLLLLSELDIARFHKTWPLLLIVIGVMVLLRRAGLENGNHSSEVNHV